MELTTDTFHPRSNPRTHPYRIVCRQVLYFNNVLPILEPRSATQQGAAEGYLGLNLILTNASLWSTCVTLLETRNTRHCFMSDESDTQGSMYLLCVMS